MSWTNPYCRCDRSIEVIDDSLSADASRCGFCDRSRFVNGIERCSECGQVDHGQTGEYPCITCGLPFVFDEEVTK